MNPPTTTLPNQRHEADPQNGNAVRRAAEEIAAVGRALTAKGILAQTSGNLSVRLDDLVLVTPSGMPYEEIEPEDIVAVSLDGREVDGRRRPSSELPLHLAVYGERPDLGAIVHTHSPMATTLAVLNRPIPAVHYMIAGLGVTEVAVAPYATYGTPELAESVRRAFPVPARAVLIGNHGVVAGARTLAEAATAAETVEILAGLYYRALAVGGGGAVLHEGEMQRVIDRYRDAGVLEPR